MRGLVSFSVEETSWRFLKRLTILLPASASDMFSVAKSFHNRVGRRLTHDDHACKRERAVGGAKTCNRCFQTRDQTHVYLSVWTGTHPPGRIAAPPSFPLISRCWEVMRGSLRNVIDSSRIEWKSFQDQTLLGRSLVS